MRRTHGLSSHKLYSVWRNIKTRLYNHNTHNYNNYGGKGITICDEWSNDFLSFYNWCMSNGYKPELTLDRRDTNVGYLPDNCRWVSYQIQTRNKGKYKNSKCKFIGVSSQFWNNGMHYLSYIRVDNKQIYLGSYDSEFTAAKIRDKYIIDNNLSGYQLNFQI